MCNPMILAVGTFMIGAAQAVAQYQLQAQAAAEPVAEEVPVL